MILFDNFSVLAQGAFAGFIFGFLLQKGRVSKYEVIVNQLLLKDFTVLKIMLTAVVVGGLGAYTLLDYGYISNLNVGDTSILKNILGGIIFGIGMAILGFCPGTVVAAAGEGAKDVWWGILGLFAGSAIYAELYPWIKTNIEPVGNMGEVTLATTIGISPYIIFIVLGIAMYFGFQWIDKKVK